MKLHVQPTVILISTKSDESLNTHLDPAGGSLGSADGDGEYRDLRMLSTANAMIVLAEGFASPYILEVRPSREFDLESAKSKLSNIRLANNTALRMAFVTPGDVESYEDYIEGNEPDHTGRQGKLLRLSGIVDLESRSTVGCAGAVLTYLQRRKAAVYLPGDDAAQPAFRVSVIEMFSLAGVM